MLNFHRSGLRSTLSAILIMLMLPACGGNSFVQPTPRPPTFTPTPRSTPLPTVATQVPLGSESRPYHVAFVAPDQNASGSELARYLSDQTSVAFEVDLLSSYAEVLRQLCSDKPTFGWLDGRALLAAQAQGCGVPVLKFQQGKSSGQKADLIVHTGIKDEVKTIAGFKGKDYCRLNGQDVQSWILPSLAMRAGGINPVQDLKGIKEFDNNAALMQAVADNICVSAAIPAGTLLTYSPKLSSGQLAVLTTTPELPFGGVIVSSTVPKTIADNVITLFTQNMDRLQGLIKVDELVKVNANDFTDFQKLAQSAGLNLKTLGQ